jgi:sulfur-carrier protein
MSSTSSGPEAVRLVYFAWVRERVGTPEETVTLPDGVATVADLVDWLKGRGEGYAAAFADAGVVRAAVDRVHAKPETAVRDAAEVAFFPPMTGG